MLPLARKTCARSEAKTSIGDPTYFISLGMLAMAKVSVGSFLEGNSKESKHCEFEGLGWLAS